MPKRAQLIATRRSRLGVTLPILGVLVVGCSVASATVGLRALRAEATGTVQVAAAPVAPPILPRASDTAATPKVRVIPLIHGVDPTPPASPKVHREPLASPAPAVQHAAAPVSPLPAPAPAASVLASSPSAPTECLPDGLRAVLQDVQGRFGPVTLISTTELRTDNHSRGSVRHKLHTTCKAADLKVTGDVKAVMAYLRSRPEVAGINVYGNNGVIHIDANERRQVAKAQ